MARSRFSLEIAAISFAALLLEIAYTRIFSFKVYYYFTYLILGIALLGLGAGGVWLAVSTRLRRVDTHGLVWAACCAGAVLVGLGYPGVAWVPLNTSHILLPGEIAKLVGVCLLMLLPFLAVGIAIAGILSSEPARVSRLYAADLSGAGLACLMAVPLLTRLGAPACVMLAGLALAAGGLAVTRGGAPRLRRAASALVCLALALPVLRPGLLPDPVPDEIKPVRRYQEAGELLFSRWSPVFRVDVSERPFFRGDAYLLSHDGLPGSAIHHFDGNLDSLARLRSDPRSLPFSVTPAEPRVLVIGAAGGQELLASLYFGAAHVVGVELNPVTVYLLTQRFADFAGHIQEDPRVDVINAEGRSFLRRSDARWDLIWLVAPDSYASMNASSSAAFVLSESYLYTVEMIRDSLAHLTPDGALVAQFGERDFEHKPNRTLRFLSTARRAFEAEGLGDFGAHVMVASAEGLAPLSESTVVLSPRPFDAGQRQRFLESTARLASGLARWVPGTPPPPGPVRHVVGLPEAELPAWLDAYPYAVGPVTDDSPFFWHFTRFRQSLRSPISRAGDFDWEDTLGEQVMLALLGVGAAVAAVGLGLPLLALRDTWAALPHKGATFVYFAGLGLGFMFLEVALIQRLTLFLGYPTRSLSITLFALLLSAGLGSRLSERGRAAPGLLLAALAGLVLLHQLAVPALFEAFGGAALWLRAALAVALIAPLGLCLGAFLPLGLARVAGLSRHPREYVAWAWAVNGFFSVLGSILSTFLAMGLGFAVLLWIAVGVYALAGLALRRVPAAVGY